MARGRGGGGGGRSSAAAKVGRAPAPATSGGGGSVFSNIRSSFVESWIWSTSWATVSRLMDAIVGPRTFRIEHQAAATSSANGIAASGAGDGASSPSNGPCQIHAMALQDCIDQKGSDISQCQFYVDILNDCRRRGQVAAVVEG